MRRLLWKIQEFIDAALDRLNDEQRWKIINFLMDHHIKNSCITSAVAWSMWPGENSFFDISKCNLCGSNPLGCYCGRERP
jgi:hypothetical protein